MKKILLPVLILSITSFCTLLINNTYYEVLIENNYFNLVGFIQFLICFILLFYFVRKFKKEEGGSILFKKAFGYSLKVILFWSLFISIISCIYISVNKDLMIKIAKYSIDKQKQEIIEKTGSISASELKMYDNFIELQTNPFYTSFFSMILMLMIGLLFSLIIASIVKTRTE